MNSQEKGSCAEFLAIAALIRNGYAVYQNTTHFGTSDIIAGKNDYLYKIQVKAFYNKRSYGGYHNEKHVYKVAEMKTSNTVDGQYHVPYSGLVDLMILVDTDTGEVYAISPEHSKCQVSKNIISQHKIFPIPD